MTQVRLGLAAPTATGAIRRPTGTLDWRPTVRREVGADVILPAGFTVGIGADTPPMIDVAPTGVDWVWRVIERVQGGSPAARYLAVPDSAGVVNYTDLVEVDPATLEPTAAPEAAWWAALEAAQLGGGGGGAGVSDHGALTGLADDDHTQYLTNTRGDVRYYTKEQTDTALGGKQAAGSYATTTALSDGLATKVNSSTYTTGLAAKANTADLATVAQTGAYADLSGKPTIPAGYTDEQVRDVIGAALVAGTNVTITPNDGADTITIAATAGGGAVSNGILVAPPPSGDTTGATDSAAIQALIDGISQNLYYGGAVQLQPGLYCGNIKMRPKVRIWGAGIGATRIIAPDGSTQPVIGTADTTQWMGGVEVAYMTIDGNNIGRAMNGVTKSTSVGLYFYSNGNAGDGAFGTHASVFDHDPNPYFHHLQIINCGGDGMYLWGTSSVGGNPAGLQATVHHCMFFNNWGAGINVVGPDCIIDNCQVGASRYHGVQLNNSTTTLSNVKSWYSGSYWDGVNYTQNDFYHGFYFKDLSFRAMMTGCTSEDNGGYAVRLENCQSIRVTSHSSAGNASGDFQLIGGTKNCQVEGLRQWTDLPPGGPLINIDGAGTTANVVDVFCDSRLAPGTRITYTNGGSATGNALTTLVGGAQSRAVDNGDGTAKL